MKRIFSGLVFLLLLCGCLPARAQEGFNVYVNEKKLNAPVLERDGVAYVPVTALAFALKISILWNPETSEIVVNEKPFSSAVLFEKGVLYVPIEAIARGVGESVEWDGAKQSIRIGPRTVKTVMEAPPENPPDTPDESPNPPPAKPERSHGGGFYVPKTAANSDFSVTVTNVESTHVIKDYYKAGSGKKFVVVHVSEQNISDQIQMYTGKFSLQDQDGNAYDYLDGLSDFYLQILRPGGINFGSLVFEIPEDDTPGSLVLQTYGNPELKVRLQ